MRNTWFARWVQTPMRRMVLLGVLAALLTSTAGVYTIISATDINVGVGDEDIALAFNTYVVDADVLITLPDLTIATGTQSAVGDSTPGVESASPAADVRTALVPGNYQYTFLVIETGTGVWQSGEDFRIRVWGYDAVGPTSTLLGTLFVQQAAVDDLNVEGVRARMDLGSGTRVYDSYDIIVDRQSET